MRRLMTVAVCGLGLAVAGVAQEKGNWHAMSKTARAITGDVLFSNEKMTLNFSSYPVAQIRELTTPEMAAVFGSVDEQGAHGNLYRLSIPAGKVFLHKNLLCGTEDTQWMVTSVAGKTLQLAFFSGSAMPVLTAEAVGNSTALCGTYGYTR